MGMSQGWQHAPNRSKKALKASLLINRRNQSERMMDLTMLKIREFIKGEDEETWLSIRNAAFKEYDDFRPGTMEDMEIWKKDPGFDEVGMFIAELDGKPIGRIHAYIDKQRKDKKGYIQGLGVIPGFRGRGFGRQLVDKAIESLKERGVQTAQTWIRDDKPIAKHIFESSGFKLVRIFSTMRRKLDAIPDNVEKNTDVMLRAMNEGIGDKKLAWKLNDEAFSEHFDYRPTTLEEWKHWFSHPDFDREGWFIAFLDGQPVGLVGTWIDSKFVQHTGVKRGWIETIGVLKPYRRKNIGTSLILHGMEHLKSKGMTEVELGVDDLNQTEAIKLYKKVGFQVIRKDLTHQKKIN
ncbi:MAG: GNAT family N-acetyltransferase [Candidatus Bathyarchaeota archaeon]|nr:MAG: GNAT family N-acetyltransferase [Candidatus Bathyarchaeota archaeon]